MRCNILIPKEALADALRQDSDATHKSLGTLFGCSDKTVAKELRRHGLRTKRWDERKHRETSCRKMSAAQIGKRMGDANPNFGDKKRPWLEGDRHPLRAWHRRNSDFGTRQTGSANPIHKVKHLYADPVYVQHITRGIRAHVDERRGSTYEEVYGLEKAFEYKEKLRRASPARLAKTPRKDTWPEQAVRGLLVSLGCVFREQVPLGYYVVDFMLAEGPLVIQADGDYWHANPEAYAENSLSQIQRKQKRLDASCNSYLRNQRYNVIRLWERELHRNPLACRTIIERALEQQFHE